MTKLEKFDCKNLEQALMEDTRELRAALEHHAVGCSACREELRMWREISAAAQTVHKDWPTPALWPRIESALETEAAKPRGWRAWISGTRLMPGARWQMALATLVLVIVSGTGAWLLLHKPAPPPVADQHLLTDQAVLQVEQAEQNYEQSIEKLAKLADPKLADASTPLLVNYREKLDLLDAAIAECRTSLAKNRANAHLRDELLSFYQEKERTLEQVLRED
jgi:hypothetical protein